MKFYWSPSERNLACDGQSVQRLTDYLDTLRTVAFCSEDVQLVKGAGRGRRRFMDFLLTQTLPAYLPLLQQYMRTVRLRNALLKKKPVDEASVISATVPDRLISRLMGCADLAARVARRQARCK